MMVWVKLRQKWPVPVYVFNNNVHSHIPLPERLAQFLQNILVLTEELAKLLKALNPSKAVGPDELHLRILEEVADE